MGVGSGGFRAMMLAAIYASPAESRGAFILG